jgi:hypothetical protein
VIRPRDLVDLVEVEPIVLPEADRTDLVLTTLWQSEVVTRRALMDGIALLGELWNAPGEVRPRRGVAPAGRHTVQDRAPDQAGADDHTVLDPTHESAPTVAVCLDNDTQPGLVIRRHGPAVRCAVYDNRSGPFSCQRHGGPPNDLAFSGVVPSVSEDHVRCNGPVGRQGDGCGGGTCGEGDAEWPSVL